MDDFSEPYGLPELIASVLMVVFFLGVIAALGGLAWAWAIGQSLWLGLVVGAIIGVLIGGFFGLVVGSQTNGTRRRVLFHHVSNDVGGPLLLIGAVGFIIGLVRSVIQDLL